MSTPEKHVLGKSTISPIMPVAMTMSISVSTCVCVCVTFMITGSILVKIQNVKNDFYRF